MPAIATWNVNSLRARMDHVLRCCEQWQPDIVALQETKVRDEDFPLADIEAAGYRALYAGQKSYNGVAILSREEGQAVTTDIPGLDDPQRRVLGARFGDWLVLNLYVPNGSEVGSEKYAYKLRWLDALVEYTAELEQQQQQFVILGDFNIAPEDRDVHDPEAWQGKVLVSDPERERLARLLKTGFVDVFRTFEQPERSYSWWDYRAGGFRRNRGLRIDLILASTRTAQCCTGCEIDSQPRSWDRPSDHAPVIATFEG